MRFFQVDVFASGPYTGNPLAVFPEASELDGKQMQRIAQEMHLSEKTFVTRYDAGSYEMRIFTPTAELPFAGHPTIGTAWVLGNLGFVDGEAIEQRTAAGITHVERRDEIVSFTRQGSVEADLALSAYPSIAEALGVEVSDIGIEAGWVARPLAPAIADAGIAQLHIPLMDEEVLRRAALPKPLESLNEGGAYCFTALGPGRWRTRGFYPGWGITEDAATGSAAATLGLLLADRLGPIEAELEQGVEMKRPASISIEAAGGSVKVGGRVVPIFAGELQNLP
ncbi:MAG: PhzF family phenazine biosynthesis protein [Actinomycetota bacterium]